VKSADLAVENCEQFLTCRGQIYKREDALQDVGLLEKACIASFKRKIIFLGKEKKFKKEVLKRSKSFESAIQSISSPSLKHVIKNGKIVARDGNIMVQERKV